jgi:integrase
LTTRSKQPNFVLIGAPESNFQGRPYIKEVCELAGIDKEVITKRSKGGKRIEERKPKHQLITSHTARRSFATNFFQLGLPAIELMKITGHSTERQFMEYINIDKRANARSMAAKVAKLMGQTPLKKVQ